MGYDLGNVLVTGGAGFIGSNFIASYLRQFPQKAIVNVDAMTYAADERNIVDFDPERHIFIKDNILNTENMAAYIQEYEINTIVHFAAESHVDRSIASPGDFIQTNVVGTFSLLEAAKKIWQDKYELSSQKCRFFHVSTDEVYGALSIDEPAFTEQNQLLPNSPYSASKASSDLLVRSYSQTFGLPVIISNCSNNFGPNQHDEKLIPTIIKCCIDQKPIPIYGSGSNIRDWLYVEDHCRAIFDLLKKGSVGEKYNIGGDNEYSNLQLTHHICGVMDEILPENASHFDLVAFVTDRAGHDFRYAINSNKLNTLTGWSPELNFSKSLKKTVLFYLAKYQ